jgi:hypothetical protein
MYKYAVGYCKDESERRIGPIVAVFHNHSKGETFTVDDIVTFVQYPFVHEMFIDSDRIYVLEKIGNYNDIINIYKNKKLIKMIKDIYINVRDKYIESNPNFKIKRVHISQRQVEIIKSHTLKEEKIKKDFKNDPRLIDELQKANIAKEDEIKIKEKEGRDLNLKIL